MVKLSQVTPGSRWLTQYMFESILVRVDSIIEDSEPSRDREHDLVCNVTQIVKGKEGRQLLRRISELKEIPK